MIGIYIHVPFCLRKCPYCDFYSVCADSELIEQYTKAVVRNIDELKDCNLRADTVYFGGGTPSLLLAGQVDEILSAVKNSVKLVDAEITMECNPSSVDLQKLCDYKSAGVNRLSFGVQSAQDNQLKTLGRLHTFDKAVQAVKIAVEAGFDNISCDIMLGLANQSAQSLEYTIEKISDLPICHISAYMLKIEEGTAFDNAEMKASIADEDMLSDFYLKTVKMLESKGFEQYEISNFAKQGRVSRHNMKYWQGEEYIGVGPAAHSFYKGKRFACPRDLQAFVSQPMQTNDITDDAPNKTEEYIMLGLRLKNGIKISRVAELDGDDLAKYVSNKAKMLSRHGLCTFDGEVVSLTVNGFLVSNEIIAQMLDF